MTVVTSVTPNEVHLWCNFVNLLSIALLALVIKLAHK